MAHEGPREILDLVDELQIRLNESDESSLRELKLWRDEMYGKDGGENWLSTINSIYYSYKTALANSQTITVKNYISMRDQQNVTGGDGAQQFVGQNSEFGDIVAQNSAAIEKSSVPSEVKTLLKDALNEINELGLSESDKDDVLTDFSKLTKQIEKNDKTLVERYWGRIVSVLGAAAAAGTHVAALAKFVNDFLST